MYAAITQIFIGYFFHIFFYSVVEPGWKTDIMLIQKLLELRMSRFNA